MYTKAFQFAIRIHSVPKKSERPIRLYWLLASLCQTTDRRITAADTYILRGSAPYTPTRPSARPPPSSLPLSALRRMEWDESIFWRESNRIESELIIFGESEFSNALDRFRVCRLCFMLCCFQFVSITMWLFDTIAYLSVCLSYDTIQHDTIEEFNVDSKAEYPALSSTHVARKKKLK